MNIIIPFLLIIFLSQNIVTMKVSNHIGTANFLGKVSNYLQSDNMSYYEKRRVFIEKLLQDDEIGEIAMNEAYMLGFLNRQGPLKNTFPCQNFTITGSGTSIHNLTPSDINVVAALGDSLTAGLGIGAKTILGLLFEDKGRVFDMGGVTDCQSLPNFFRVYNPNLKGVSMLKTFMKSEVDGFNMAISGATSKDLMSQVEALISAMKTNPSVNMAKDWKLINIFIGNNDICRSCERRNAASFTSDLFRERLIAALDKLKKEIPRAFISLIPMLDVFEVHNLNIGLICKALHLYECPCVAFSSDIESVIKVNDEFQSVIIDIGKSGRYDDSDDFVVVTQPFFVDTNIPYIDGKPDLSYFAPDCFHLSEKGHGQVALSLWNSLFESVNSKRTSWHVGEEFECPSINRPYLATTKNSS